MDRADSREAALLRLVFGGQQANEALWSEQHVHEALCALCATPHGRGVLTKRAQAVGARACVWPSRVAGTRILRRIFKYGAAMVDLREVARAVVEAQREGDGESSLARQTLQAALQSLKEYADALKALGTQSSPAHAIDNPTFYALQAASRSPAPVVDPNAAAARVGVESLGWRDGVLFGVRGGAEAPLAPAAIASAHPVSNVGITFACSACLTACSAGHCVCPVCNLPLCVECDARKAEVHACSGCDTAAAICDELAKAGRVAVFEASGARSYIVAEFLAALPTLASCRWNSLPPGALERVPLFAGQCLDVGRRRLLGEDVVASAEASEAVVAGREATVAAVLGSALAG